ncbi:hypothetical protein HK414_06625 [Ramlibacter terrae]|uniref:Tripartite tricarboxylate transporter family receptor n=1 Tax=Ramlibacter terrae TaxID=2732511 RepID=A0ABX6P3U3_9BURK|nr:hypothetical protein HK414_06625 [Ramlibacter terrae]
MVRRIHAALEQALANPTLNTLLIADGMEPMKATPEQYGQLVKSDTERWGQLTRSLNLKAN